MLAMPGDLPAEVVCHNDFAPYNVVFGDDGPVGVIDWETAAPGARVWDVAYAAYRFVPLSRAAPEELQAAPVQARRLADLLRRLRAGRGRIGRSCSRPSPGGSPRCAT